jgi:hypothetical protein
MLMADLEHRSLKRQPLRARVIFLLRREAENEIGELRDMNRNGAFFYTNVPVTTGAVVVLLLLVRSERATVPVFCAGVAVRIERGGETGYRYGVAVKFWQLETPDTFMSNSC